MSGKARGLFAGGGLTNTGEDNEVQGLNTAPACNRREMSEGKYVEERRAKGK